MAGGVLEYAQSKDIRIMRTENGKPGQLQVQLQGRHQGKNLKQNIELKPGDTVMFVVSFESAREPNVVLETSVGECGGRRSDASR